MGKKLETIKMGKKLETIINARGDICNLSNEVYVYAYPRGYNKEDKKWGHEEGEYRLISGVDDNDEVGYHFSRGWVTACPEGSELALFCGFQKSDLKLKIYPLQFREYKRTFEESMKKTMVHVEPIIMEKEIETLTSYLGMILANEFPLGISVDSITVEKYGIGVDERNGWDTHIVLIEGYGVIGFLNRNLNGL